MKGYKEPSSEVQLELERAKSIATSASRTPESVAKNAHTHTQLYQGLIDSRSGERACNSVYACRDGEMLAVTKNRTLPFSKARPNPSQKWAKT